MNLRRRKELLHQVELLLSLFDGSGATNYLHGQLKAKLPILVRQVYEEYPEVLEDITWNFSSRLDSFHTGRALLEKMQQDLKSKLISKPITFILKRKALAILRFVWRIKKILAFVVGFVAAAITILQFVVLA